MEYTRRGYFISKAELIDLEKDMTRDSILCIIDMQFNKFPSDQKQWTRAVQSILREIDRANSVGAKVLLIEHEFTAVVTLKSITERLKRYELVVKKDHDGSLEILQCLRNTDFDKIYVCGSYTGCCIVSTVGSLRMALGNNRVDVIAEACYDRPWEENFLPHELRKRCVL